MYRLGHREPKDEWIPRLVEVFQRHNVLPPTAIVSAGSVNSACTAGMCCSTKNCLMKILLITIYIIFLKGNQEFY